MMNAASPAAMVTRANRRHTTPKIIAIFDPRHEKRMPTGRRNIKVVATMSGRTSSEDSVDIRIPAEIVSVMTRPQRDGTRIGVRALVLGCRRRSGGRCTTALRR